MNFSFLLWVEKSGDERHDFWVGLPWWACWTSWLAMSIECAG